MAPGVGMVAPSIDCLVKLSSSNLLPSSHSSSQELTQCTEVRPKVPLLNSFNFKKFMTIAKHLRRVPFKILLKIYNERPDYLLRLIDVSGQRTSVDSTMSIPTLGSLKKSIQK